MLHQLEETVQLQGDSLHAVESTVTTIENGLQLQHRVIDRLATTVEENAARMKAALQEYQQRLQQQHERLASQEAALQVQPHLFACILRMSYRA